MRQVKVIKRDTLLVQLPEVKPNTTSNSFKQVVVDKLNKRTNPNLDELAKFTEGVKFHGQCIIR